MASSNPDSSTTAAGAASPAAADSYQLSKAYRLRIWGRMRVDWLAAGINPDDFPAVKRRMQIQSAGLIQTIESMAEVMRDCRQAELSDALIEKIVTSLVTALPKPDGNSPPEPPIPVRKSRILKVLRHPLTVAGGVCIILAAGLYVISEFCRDIRDLRKVLHSHAQWASATEFTVIGKPGAYQIKLPDGSYKPIKKLLKQDDSQ